MVLRDFTTRVTMGSGLLGGVGALVAACGWGWRASIGVSVGALVAILNFGWLARAVALAGGMPEVPRRRARWILLVIGRHLVSFGALAAPAAAGVAHPVALAAGLTVLPVMMTVFGLRGARIGMH